MKELEFRTEVETEGRVLIKDYGFLGRLKEGPAIVRASGIPEDYVLFTVDGKKNVIPRRVEDDHALYDKRVMIKKNSQGICHTEYAENNFRVLKTQNDGSFEVWEISLISQNGNFYLSRQLTYRERCFWDGEVVCPALDKWPQMVELLEKVFQGYWLRPIKDYRPRSIPNATMLGEGIGYVLWWNVAMGIGAIATREGVARVHWSKIQGPNNRLQYLKGHSLVRFKELVEPRQNSDHQTAFKLEAVGVSS